MSLSQKVTGGHHSLFIKPFLGGAAESLTAVAAQMPDREVAELRQHHGIESRLTRQRDPVVEIFQIKS